MSSFRRRGLLSPPRGQQAVIAEEEQDEPEPNLSLDSSSLGYNVSTPFSEDMDQILSPTMETFEDDNNNNDDNDNIDNNISSSKNPSSPKEFLDTIQTSYSLGNYSALGSTFSADDSIIQRVEEEIAAARRAAAAPKNNQQQQQQQQQRHKNGSSVRSSSGGGHQDEKKTSSPSDNHHEIPQVNSSFDHVLHLIDHEFDGNDDHDHDDDNDNDKQDAMSAALATIRGDDSLEPCISDVDSHAESSSVHNYYNSTSTTTTTTTRDYLAYLESNIEGKVEDLIMESRESFSPLAVPTIEEDEEDETKNTSLDTANEVAAGNEPEKNSVSMSSSFLHDMEEADQQQNQNTAACENSNEVGDSILLDTSEDKSADLATASSNQASSKSGGSSDALVEEPEEKVQEAAMPETSTPVQISEVDSSHSVTNETTAEEKADQSEGTTNPSTNDAEPLTGESYTAQQDVEPDISNEISLVDPMFEEGIEVEPDMFALATEESDGSSRKFDDEDDDKIKNFESVEHVDGEAELDAGVEIELASHATTASGGSDANIKKDPDQAEKEIDGSDRKSEMPSLDKPSPLPDSSKIDSSSDGHKKEDSRGKVEEALTQEDDGFEEKKTAESIDVSPALETPLVENPPLNGVAREDVAASEKSLSMRASDTLGTKAANEKTSAVDKNQEDRPSDQVTKNDDKSAPMSPALSPGSAKPLSPKSYDSSSCKSPPRSPARSSARANNLRAKHRLQDNTPKRPEKEEEEKPEIPISKQSRKIRFRKPFPVLKPPPGPRSSGALIEEHSIGVPKANIRWMKPKKELKQLIVAAMGTSLQRRSNACGALKVLTSQKKNQLTLVRTDSFLTALVFTASQDISKNEMDLALDARTRAVACLRNVCMPKENRSPVFSHPGLIECLLRVVDEDIGEGRTVACAALALLAKTPECREGLVEEVTLLEILSRILIGPPLVKQEPTEPPVAEEKQRDDDSLSDMSHSTADSDSYSDEHSDNEDDHSLSSKSSEESETKSRNSHLESQAINRVDSIRIRKENMMDKFHEQGRVNACAVLVHLSRSCAISHKLAQCDALIESCIQVATEVSSPIHTKCVEILRNLTLFPANNALLSRRERVVLTFVAAANSTLPENRISALRALQNMSGDASSRSILASKTVLNLMTSCAMRKDPGEKEAAVATLYNITTEPSTVVAITNTKNVVATLVHLAHNPESTSEIRLLACEALATTSLWLQTLAGTGKVPEGLANVPLPSQKTYGWERWD